VVPPRGPFFRCARMRGAGPAAGQSPAPAADLRRPVRTTSRGLIGSRLRPAPPAFGHYPLRRPAKSLFGRYLGTALLALDLERRGRRASHDGSGGAAHQHTAGRSREHPPRAHRSNAVYRQAERSLDTSQRPAASGRAATTLARDARSPAGPDGAAGPRAAAQGHGRGLTLAMSAADGASCAECVSISPQVRSTTIARAR